VNLTEHGAYCSCPDALYRGVTCKHAVAVALSQIHLPEKKTPEPMHLAWHDGKTLCGTPWTARTLDYHRWNAGMTRWPETCPDCAHAYEHPAAIPVRVAA
jgi:hypothetical protein